MSRLGDCGGACVSLSLLALPSYIYIICHVPAGEEVDYELSPHILMSSLGLRFCYGDGATPPAPPPPPLPPRRPLAAKRKRINIPPRVIPR